MSKESVLLDEKDAKILEVLQRNGHLSHAEIGRLVGLGVSAVNDRIRRLVQRGVIVGWVARLGTGSLGLDLLAFVYFVISPLECVAPFLAMVTSLPEVQECHNTAGEWDFLLKIRVRNTTALEALLTDWQRTSPGIVRTQSVITLTSQKESSALAIPR